MMGFTVLSENPHQALEALAVHRYLTAKQIVSLGIASSPTTARDHVLAKLKQGRYPLIKTHDFGRWPGYGRLPHIHYLSPRGVKYLAEINNVLEKSIRYPKGGVQFTRDLFHRISVIDCHIAIRKWAEENSFDVTHSALYFDKQGAQRGQGQVCDTRLDLGNMGIIEPDGILVLKRDEFVVPLIVEVHRYPDSKRIAEQLNKHGYERPAKGISLTGGATPTDCSDGANGAFDTNYVYDDYRRLFETVFPKDSTANVNSANPRNGVQYLKNSALGDGHSFTRQWMNESGQVYQKRTRFGDLAHSVE